MEVEFAAEAANFADLIAALRPPLGGPGGVWGGEAPQLECGGVGGRQPPNTRKGFRAWG